VLAGDAGLVLLALAEVVLLLLALLLVLLLLVFLGVPPCDAGLKDSSTAVDVAPPDIAVDALVTAFLLLDAGEKKLDDAPDI
jgi:hypothetical protein